MVRGWWSASSIILLWSRVGGQVCNRSLEGPFRNAFAKTSFELIEAVFPVSLGSPHLTTQVGADLFGIYEDSEVLSPEASQSPVAKPKITTLGSTEKNTNTHTHMFAGNMSL